MNLDELAVKYVTDKAHWGHDYCRRVYQRLFDPLREAPIELLELGVQTGGSLRLWSDFFHPTSRIVGIDRDPTEVVGELPSNVEVYAADQSEMPGGLHGWSPDVVIDDASHVSSKTVGSFKTWWPNLKPGGIYVVEDLHTSYLEGFNSDGEVSAMNFLKSLADGLYVPGGSDVESVQFFFDITVVRKVA